VVAGTVYTWTIALTNTGDAATNNLIVTETLGNGWQFVSASAGAPGGTAPVAANGVITWARRCAGGRRRGVERHRQRACVERTERLSHATGGDNALQRWRLHSDADVHCLRHAD
jgi:uncharacterized repeat protein (TIGR01451 family)